MQKLGLVLEQAQVSFSLCLLLSSAERGALAWEWGSVSSTYSLWPLDVSRKPPVLQCHHQQNVLNRPASFTARAAMRIQWTATLENLRHDATMRHFYKLDLMLLIRSIAIYWIPSPLKLFDEIKGNVLWLEDIGAITSQIHAFMKRVEPRTPRTKCHRRIPKPQKKGKCIETWVFWVSWPHFQIDKIGKLRALLTKLLTCFGNGKWIIVAITHHLPFARYSTRRVSGGTLSYSFQPPCEVIEKKTGFQRDKRYDKVERRKVVGFIKFLWMTKE